MPNTYLASTANLAWNVIKSYGIDPSDIFAAAHIDIEKIKCADCRISYHSVNELWKRMIRLIKDPCLGLRGADYWHPSYLNALGYAWLASSTLHEALARLVRYIHIVTETIGLELEEHDDGIDLILEYRGAYPEIPQRCDGKMATFMAMCRANYGEALTPIKVCFKHERPVCEEMFHDFFRSPVSFDQPRNILSLRREDVRHQLSGANPYLADINDKVVVDYMAHQRKNDIVQRTTAIIVKELSSGNVSNEMIAEKLFMSVRSFQRALHKAGMTYRALLADIRRDMANGYIKDPKIELQEVAFLLGFTEYSAFSRAFKQWTGNSPAKLRASLPDTMQP